MQKLMAFTNDSCDGLSVDRVQSEQHTRDPGRQEPTPMRREDSNPPRESRCGSSMQQGVEHVEASCRPVAHVSARQ
jgi:hypothetical protein